MSGLSGMFGGLNASVSGMQAERQRLEVAMSNIANAQSTRGEDGGLYQPRHVVFETVFNEARNGAVDVGGVRVAEIAPDEGDPIKVFMPQHPDSDAEGYVEFPNVNVALEMVDVVSASRSYEANAAVFKIAKGMFQRALELGRS